MVTYVHTIVKTHRTACLTHQHFFLYELYLNKKRCIFFKEMRVCPALNCLVFMKSDIELAMASDTLGSNPAAGPWRSHIASFHFYLCKQK